MSVFLLDKEYNKVEVFIKKSQEFTMRAFVFMNTELGYMETVRQTLIAIEGVTEVHLLYGEYDLIAIVNVKTMKRLKEVIGWQIRKVQNIRTSQTLIVMEYD
jgi:DNA-binding Lrp family transcriptional regulator